MKNNFKDLYDKEFARLLIQYSFWDGKFPDEQKIKLIKQEVDENLRFVPYMEKINEIT